MFSKDLIELTTELIRLCRDRKITVATAESGTGGLIGGCITSVSGSSDVFDRGFITYTNQAKHDLLGVPMALFDSHGAVSEPVARAMCEGALANAPVQLTVAVTGVAGPGGGTPDKPVGTVHIASAFEGAETLHHHCTFGGNRDDVRVSTIHRSIEMMIEHLS